MFIPRTQPAPATREESIEQGVSLWRIIGLPGFFLDEPAVRQPAGAAHDRALHPSGTDRHIVAILTQPDRTPDLALLEMPTLVIHGEDDPLVDPSGGMATSAAVPGARLKLIPGMGYSLPPELFDELAADFADHFAKG